MPEVGAVGAQLVVDAALAILVLVVTTTLSVYEAWAGPPTDGEGYYNEVPFGLKIFRAASLVTTSVPRRC